MPRPEIVLIAALAENNRVIGRDLDLPWHLPEDLKRFKRLTVGYPLVMGRRTFDSLLHQFGGPLPKRRNIVLTSDQSRTYPDYSTVEVYHGVDEVLEALEGEPRIFIGGGSTIYAAFLDHAHRMELTLVEGNHEGNVFFPVFEHLVGSVFEITADEPQEGFRFVTYQRIAKK